MFGSGGHSKVVIDIIEQGDLFRIAGIIDDNRTVGERFFGYPVLTRLGDLPSLVAEIHGGLVAVGDNYARANFVGEIKRLAPNFRFIYAIHPSASVGRDVSIREGTVVMANAAINSGSDIGKHCMVNTNASVDHDCTLEDFVTITPNAATGGRVFIGRYSVLSMGVSVVHRVKIGEHTVVGAGSTVLHDLPSYVVAYGTPARVVRSRSAGEGYS